MLSHQQRPDSLANTQSARFLLFCFCKFWLRGCVQDDEVRLFVGT